MIEAIFGILFFLPVLAVSRNTFIDYATIFGISMMAISWIGKKIKEPKPENKQSKFYYVEVRTNPYKKIYRIYLIKKGEYLNNAPQYTEDNSFDDAMVNIKENWFCTMNEALIYYDSSIKKLHESGYKQKKLARDFDGIKPIEFVEE